MNLIFNKNFLPNYKKAVKITEKVKILTANNANEYTFHGTNSYILGNNHIMILDPGPNQQDHFENLLKTIDNRPVSHILLTHAHHDHSDLAMRLAKHVAAPVVKAPLNTTQTSNDKKHMDITFDISLSDNMVITNNEITLQAIATPGHSSDHMAFLFHDENILFSGDHVMAWATSAIIPPDGAMGDYMASLEKLTKIDADYYLPGHGGTVNNPQQLLRGLRHHRKMRENAIIERIKNGDRTIIEIANALYRNLDPKLKKAALCSIWAHLIYLYQRRLIHCNTIPSLDSVYSSV